MTLPDPIAEIFTNPPWFELAANCVNLTSIVLATRNSIHTWWCGILGCTLLGYLFFESQLYADATLQLFFIGASALGWWQWLHHRGRRIDRPIARTTAKEYFLYLPTAAIVTLGYGWTLHSFTDAYAPYVDSLVLTLSVVAQLLLMSRRLETWIFWFAVNSIAIPLYASRDLWLTSAFYCLFWINAPVGFINWLRIRRAESVSKIS